MKQMLDWLVKEKREINHSKRENRWVVRCIRCCGGVVWCCGVVVVRDRTEDNNEIIDIYEFLSIN